jgi:hypothetical protein
MTTRKKNDRYALGNMRDALVRALENDWTLAVQRNGFTYEDRPLVVYDPAAGKIFPSLKEAISDAHFKAAKYIGKHEVAVKRIGAAGYQVIVVGEKKEDGWALLDSLAACFVGCILMALTLPVVQRVIEPPRDAKAEVRWAKLLVRAGNAARIDSSLVSWTHFTPVGATCEIYQLVSTLDPSVNENVVVCDID